MDLANLLVGGGALVYAWLFWGAWRRHHRNTKMHIAELEAQIEYCESVMSMQNDAVIRLASALYGSRAVEVGIRRAHDRGVN